MITFTRTSVYLYVPDGMFLIAEDRLAGIRPRLHRYLDEFRAYSRTAR